LIGKFKIAYILNTATFNGHPWKIIHNIEASPVAGVDI
jgi:hypothetical protein